MSQEIYNMNKDYEASLGSERSQADIVILVLFDWLDDQNNKR